MKKWKMQTAEGMVRRVLEEDVESRNNDARLICEVYRRYGVNVDRVSFAEVLESELPTMSGITRVRRKLQETCPELRARKSVRESRQASMQEVLDYVREKP